MVEIWKDICGYEKFYQVSNMGRVRSLNYHRTGEVRVLKMEKDRGGYLALILSKNGKVRRHLVHRLVAQTFIPNPDNLPCINHKDERPENNRVDNLEWCDYKYNINYGTHNEKLSKTLTNHPLLAKPVIQYTIDGTIVREWQSMKEAKRNGFDQANISACCCGKRHSHKGYLWRYKD